jgi:hypothetical protein
MWLRFAVASSFIFSFLFAISTSQAILINEVMYNPSDFLGGTSNEWIELYNPSNETINLSGWSISDPYEHSITDSFIQSLGFVILAKNLTAFYEHYNFSCNATKVAFSLNNDGEEVILKNGGNGIEDALNYSDDVGGDGDGKSIQIIDGRQIVSMPTPCEKNTFYNETENETNANNTCDLKLWIISDDIFTPDEGNGYRIMVEDLKEGEFEPEIEYWIEDMFENIVRSRDKTVKTNTNKTWTPPEVLGSEAYIIRTIITNATCNDTNISNNYAEKMVIVKGHAPILNSSISIMSVNLGSDNKAKFGDRIEMQIKAYKGDTSKNSIELWVENTEGIKLGKTDFNLYSKFLNYTFSIPMQLTPNCDLNIPNGPYFVRVRGLDSFDEKEIWVDGISTSLCKTKTVEIPKSCSCSPCPSCNTSGKNELQHKHFEVVSCPEEIAQNMELFIELLINTTQAGNYTLYSYIYDGKKPLSLGFDGKKWLNTWSANKQEIYADGPTNITLKNRIANDTELGKYKLRIKIIYGGKEEEITRDIVIKEAASTATQKTEAETTTENNENYKNGEYIKENETKKEIKTPTGGIVSKNEDNWFSIAINNLMNFFKSLFRL